MCCTPEDVKLFASEVLPEEKLVETKSLLVLGRFQTLLRTALPRIAINLSLDSLKDEFHILVSKSQRELPSAVVPLEEIFVFLPRSPVIVNSMHVST